MCCAVIWPRRAQVGDRTVESVIGPASPRSPSVARGLLREALDAFPAEVVDTAQILLSELVTNAVVHTQSLLTAQIAVDPPNVKASVEDTSQDQPLLRAAGPNATNGRGLWLVGSLATAWGWEKTLVGKRFWFEL